MPSPPSRTPETRTPQDDGYAKRRPEIGPRRPAPVTRVALVDSRDVPLEAALPAHLRRAFAGLRKAEVERRG